MRLILKRESGTFAYAMGEGGSCRVGRQDPAEFRCPDDIYISDLHFMVACGPQCSVADLSGHPGTFLNGQRVTQGVLRDGDLISAGQTCFRIRICPDDGLSPSSDRKPAQLTPVQKKVLETLRGFEAPLFALLDAARDDGVRELMESCDETYQSLYEGKQGEDLANQAPYLVALRKESPFLPTLVTEGWEKSWGVYLSCGSSFQELRKHLRHFLLVRTGEGKQVYFRFYDPRVLRVFMRNWTGEEALRFFGPASCYFIEGARKSSWLQCTLADGMPNIKEERC